MRTARKRLAILWFIFGGFLFLILFLQTLLTSYYGDKVDQAWSWFLPTIFPTLSLITAVFVNDALDQDKPDKSVDNFFYILTFALSLVYLAAISLVFLICPLTQANPIDLMKLSNFGLGPLQGIIVASMGIFFLKKGNQ
ncbi:MAG: hypothetical protein NT040_15770 [Bacteroidetes bacterium]|nr:hypothetical protein [Bacteroidota bacterium]